MFNFSYLDGDFQRSPYVSLYMSQFIWFARICSSVKDITHRNQFFMAKILKQDWLSIA